MAGYKKHILAALLFSVLLGLFLHGLDIQTYSSCVFSCMIYSMIPDIDKQGSLIRKITIGLLVISIAGFIASKSYVLAMTSSLLGALLILGIFSHHRGFFHTIVAGGLFSLPLIFFMPEVAIFSFLGYLTHLLVDGRIKFI